MKLFLIERTDDHDYDEHDSAVVRAGSEQEVIANLFTLNERGAGLLLDYVNIDRGVEEPENRRLLSSGYNLYGLIGFTRENTKIEELTYDGESGVILASFNAG